MAILGALGALITGIGGQLVTDVVGMVGEHYKHKRKMEELELGYNHETKLLEMRAQISQGERQHELDLKIEEAQERALAKSFEHDTSFGSGGYSWVEAIRALFRPFLTLALGVVLTLIYFTTGDVPDLEAYVTIGLVDAGLAAIGWWFSAMARKRQSAQWGVGYVNRSNVAGPYGNAGIDNYRTGDSADVPSGTATASHPDLMEERVDK